MTVEIELKLENGIVFDDRYMILECLGEVKAWHSSKEIQLTGSPSYPIQVMVMVQTGQ